jgi:predicted permease
MARIGEWIRRLAYLLRRGAVEEALRREMEGHRALMDDPRAFGNVLRLREEAQDAWGWTWLDDVARDVRLALRTLRQHPGFALTAIATLALGIGANVGMFTAINSLLLRPLYDHADDVVSVRSRSTASGESRGVSYPNYLDVRAGTTDVFVTLAAASTEFVGLDVGNGARRTLMSSVTANYFQIFDRPLAMGRFFTLEEERPGADLRVAIVSSSVWQQRGADPHVLGQSVRINGEAFTVVGVAAEGFTGTSIPGPDVWLPLGARASVVDTASTGVALDARDAHVLGVVGRLRAGTSVETASAAVATVAERLARSFPGIDAGYTLATSTPTRLLFMPDASPRTATALSLLLMLMPAIVLLVACLNLANLLLARGHARRQELAIRSSLGGGRSRLIRQLLTEGLLLALAGAAGGLLLSTWATRALLASLRNVLPVALALPALDHDWRVLVGTLAAALAATLVFGAWPAWHLTRRATILEPRSIDDGRQPGSVRIGNALVIGQVALSLLLLASGGLFLQSSMRAATADPGFRLDGGLLAEIDPGLSGYDEVRTTQLYLVLMERLRAVAGVDAVTIASSFPFTGLGDSRTVAPAGKMAGSTSVDARYMAIGPDFVRTLGLPMLGGRDFTDAELSSGSSARIAIVDDVLAQRLWPNESALDRLIQFLDEDATPVAPPIRIVGIVPALKHSLGNPHPAPHVYVPLPHHQQEAMTLLVRVAGDRDDAALLGTVARMIGDVDARVPVLRLERWRDHLHGSLEMWLYRAGAWVCSTFGALALLLAVIGVYGVKSYVVSRRTREFGIRIAVGAHPGALVWQVLLEGGRVTALGIGVGMLLALAAGLLLQSVLYGVRAVEPMVLLAAPAILLAASLLASFLPARRATRVNPTVALRSE